MAMINGWGGLAAGLLAVSLAGCAAQGGSGHAVPARTQDGAWVLSGRFAGNVAASGEVKPGDRGQAAFSARAASGLGCTGSFAVHGESTQFVPFTCSDGHNGQAVVTLRDDRASGSIVLVYDSGAHARFAFGGLAFEDAFEDQGKFKN